nr:MAG TPA: hypothetical protein [Caudoviricetes sp.]
MTIQSDVTGAFYEPANCCFIMNAKQTALYMKNGIRLLDVLVSKDDKLVYVFDKIDSRDLYRKWMDRELT